MTGVLAAYETEPPPLPADAYTVGRYETLEPCAIEYEGVVNDVRGVLYDPDEYVGLAYEVN